MVVLGLRYPKTFGFGQMSVSGADAVWLQACSRNSGTPYANITETGYLPIAPSRYSEVRKVVFSATVRKVTGVSYPARMRVALVSSALTSKVLPTFTLAAGEYKRTQGASSSLPVGVPFNAGHLFDAIGTSTSGNLPVSSDQFAGAVHLLQVTFDRFAPEDTDFFEIWDSISDNDQYAFFRIVFERTDGSNYSTSASNELQCDNIDVAIVQAPAGVNKTCTIVPVTHGWADASMTTTFTGAGVGFRYPYHWRYDASQWDNIQSVTFLGNVRWGNTAVRQWHQGLHEITTNEPYAVSLLNSEGQTDALAGRASGDVGWFRGLNIFGSIGDGDSVCMLFDNDNASAIAVISGWLEIIQSGFTKTVCNHPIPNAVRINLRPGSDNRGIQAQALFDPTWYQALPDELILDRKLYIAYNHTDNAIDTTLGLFIDDDLFSDVDTLTTSAPTLVGLTPTVTATVGANDGRKFRFAAPVVDPLNLAGQRKLVLGIIVQSTSVVAEDFHGDAGLLYALSIPNTEFLPLGDVFETGAFAPEGCAATSAGLGDPGMLFISNGSTGPKKFDPLQGNITPAGMPTPFPDEIPVYVLEDTSLSPEGGLPNGTYIYRYTIKDCCTGKESDPNPDDIEVVITGAVPAAKVTFSFAGIRLPSDNLCEVCIYRTVAGGVFPVMAKVGCFNPDLTEEFEDDLADSELDFLNDQLSILNAPMPCVPYIVGFRNRIFGAGDIPIHSPAGTVSVENGSDIVTGDGSVEWDRCLEGRYIMLAGDCRAYEIDRVLPPELGISPPIARLQLVEPYEGTTQNEASYEICGHPNRLYYSEPLEGEQWPVVNFIDVEPGDGDRIMGLATNFDRLIIYKRRKTYVLTFGETPAEVNVPARISSDIGLVAPRSPAQIENGTVGLAERGLQIFDGRGVMHVQESSLINDLFTDPANSRYVRRDDLSRVMDAVGVFYPKREQYLLLLPTVQTTRGCNLMLVWDVKLRNITLFEFCQQFQSMVVGRDAAGNEIVYLGDVNGFVWAFDVGFNDGVGTPGATGTVRGTLTGFGVEDTGANFLEDSDASFIEGGVPALGGLSGVAGLSPSLDGDSLGIAGVCVHLRAPGETVWLEPVTIFASTSTRLYIAEQIDFDPTGYEYMIGAIRFEAVFKPFNYGSDDYTKRLWDQKLIHRVEEFNSKLLIELMKDFEDEDQFEGDILNDTGETGRLFQMSFSHGKQIRRIERVIHTYLQLRMSNFAPDEPIRIINHVIKGTPQESR